MLHNKPAEHTPKHIPGNVVNSVGTHNKEPSTRAGGAQILGRTPSAKPFIQRSVAKIIDLENAMFSILYYNPVR